ncbi:MAG TPA: alpha/beta fold hydrolase [Anaeromyxobacteraceae bacterium]
MSTALAVLAGLAAAAIAHHLYWSWRLRVPPGDDELLRARTDDGWELALGRRRPAGPRRAPPVLLLHGLAVNRLFLAFGRGSHSLAGRLAAAGLDCFTLDLRGHGSSRPGPGAPRDWTFDDYVRRDLPAALDAVRAATGAPRALLLGHSQGALLALAAAALHADRVAGAVAIAGPVWYAPGPRLRRFARMAFRLRRVTRLLARELAPFAGLLHPAAAQVPIATRNVDRPLLRRMLANAVEDVAGGVARQFRWWIREDLFRSLDGRDDYRALLGACRQPALFLAGALDQLAPPEVVRRARDAWGGEAVYACASRAAGLSADYGHGDLVFGRRAPEEVYPLIRDWLLARTR